MTLLAVRFLSAVSVLSVVGVSGAPAASAPAVVTSAAYLSAESDVVDTAGWLRTLFGFALDEDQQRCAREDKVYHRPTKQCAVLYRRGPCQRYEWLVFDRRAAVTRGELEAVCVRRKCAPNWGFDAAKGRCFEQSACRRPLAFHYTLFGEGVCRCNGTTARLASPSDGDTCHELYRHPPCDPGMMLAPRYRLLEGMDGMCFRDPCANTTASTPTPPRETVTKAAPEDNRPHSHAHHNHPRHRNGETSQHEQPTPRPLIPRNVDQPWSDPRFDIQVDVINTGRLESQRIGFGDDLSRILHDQRTQNIGRLESQRIGFGDDPSRNLHDQRTQNIGRLESQMIGFGDDPSRILHDQRTQNIGRLESQRIGFGDDPSRILHDQRTQNIVPNGGPVRSLPTFKIELSPTSLREFTARFSERLAERSRGRSRRGSQFEPRPTRDARGEADPRVGDVSRPVQQEAFHRGEAEKTPGTSPDIAQASPSPADDYQLEVQYADGTTACMTPSQLNVACDLTMVSLFSDYSDVKVPICVNTLFRFAIGRFGKSEECVENDDGECAKTVVVRSEEPLDWELE